MTRKEAERLLAKIRTGQLDEFARQRMVDKVLGNLVNTALHEKSDEKFSILIEAIQP